MRVNTGMAAVRSLAWLLGGVLAGAMAMTLYLGSGATGRAADSALLRGVGNLLPAAADPPQREITVAEQLGAYRAAQQQTDVEQLIAELRALASAPASAASHLAIDAQLARLSELDPAAAAELAVAAGLDRRFVAAAFILWADVEPAAALAGLARIGSPMLRRDAALAMLDVLGRNTRGFDQVAAALPPAERGPLTVEWLALRTADDPYGAIRAAQALGDPALRERGLLAVARAWTALDPLSALAQAELLDSSAGLYRREVLIEWVRLDSTGFAAYASAQRTLADAEQTALQYLALIAPAYATEVLAGMSGPGIEGLRSMAFGLLALTEPETAIAEFRALPNGRERDALAQSIGRALASSDPRAAYDWIAGLESPSADVITGVALAIAPQDFRLALDLSDRLRGSAQYSLMLGIGSINAVSSNPSQAGAIADALLERTDAQSQAAMRNVVTNWMQRDQAAALDWVTARDAELDGETLRNAATRMAERDPAGAAALADQVPMQHRPAWVVQVADQYARSNPDAAMAWHSRYAGQDYYEAALASAIPALAQSDLTRARALLESEIGDAGLRRQLEAEIGSVAAGSLQ
jgi:hypothetical protein